MTLVAVIACAVAAQAAAPIRAPVNAPANTPANTPATEDGERVVAVEKSAFGTVYVVDDGDRRFLRFDGAHGDDQSEVSRAHPERVPMEYVRVAAAGLVLAQQRERALVIGTGGGAFPMLARRALPKMRIDAVDIDPVVLQLAQKYFGLVADDHLALHVADGAAFVAQLPKERAYDVVLLDAYTGTGIPAHLTTPAFLADVCAHTSAGGVVVANVALDDARQNSAFIATFARAFPACASLTGHEGGNVVLVGARALPDVTRALRASTLALPFELGKEIDVVAACAR